ncbi:MAG: hypothetical protein ILO36_00915 [Abditibacteriota bacterium]|nr:hypothetical protein [Abditibacteriota bacterium]
MKLGLALLVICLAAGALYAGNAGFEEGMNSFGFGMLTELDKGKNVMVSPVSLEMVLGSLQGAGTFVEKQAISKAVGIKETSLNIGSRDLIALAREMKDMDLEIANSIWLNNGLEPSQTYKGFLSRYYDSEIRNIDFSASEQAAAAVNGWCSDKTRGMIDSVLSPRDAATCRLLLVNALYFKALWANPFSVRNTRKEDFRPYEGSPYPVWMMHRTGSYRFVNTEKYDAVRIPYAGGRFAMDIIVPADKEAMAEYLRQLKNEKYSLFFGEETGQEMLCELSVPVFEASSEASMLQRLVELGMKKEGYPRMLSGGGRVIISDVLQSVKIKADENGTEAAAVTTMPMALIAPNMGRITVDRPFVFNIYETKKGAIFFTGVIYDPGRAEGERKAAPPEGDVAGEPALTAPALL